MGHLTILIKGAGEKASAVAYTLYQSGLRKIILTDLPRPLSERRGVSFSEAVYEGHKEVSGVVAKKVNSSPPEIREIWEEGWLPVVVDPDLQVLKIVRPQVLVDAVMAKRNTGTTLGLAPLVIALGPGFIAGSDVHLVVVCLREFVNFGDEYRTLSTYPPGTSIPKALFYD
jgi:xanthine dehydrogenase accessory factor